jgi:serine/threonine protein kinase
MKPLAANTLLQNRYLIVHLIGKGGMGDVYLAIDQRLGSAVALKRTFFSGDEMLANAFEREARTLARLRHNVLPKVSDHFTEDDMQYLIMEHIAGDDLAKRLEVSEKPFPVGWVLFWADQLLDALGYMHSQEPPVIHRDIKPQNLKLTAENTIILLDFGLSKNTLGETRSATTGSVVGYTPHFAPMEQIRGMGTNPRSDIYSLSATLYQLLTNVVPPDVLTRAEDLLGGKPDPIQPLNAVNPDISEKVSDVILKGMAVSQEQRFSDSREMQKALREAHALIQNGNQAQTVALDTQSHNEVSGISQPQLRTNISIAPPLENKSANSFTRENIRQSEKSFSQPTSQPPIRKKSNRRLLTIIGFGLPVILAIAAGLGWFMLYNSEAATEKNPTPTPQTATATATPESTFETNVNENINANSDANMEAENNLNANANGQIDNQTEDANTQQNSIDNIDKPAKPTVKTTPKQLPKAQPKVKKSVPKSTPPPKATPLPRILP